jgi:uncharacterized C2H2 Zn-finger protein
MSFKTFISVVIPHLCQIYIYIYILDGCSLKNTLNKRTCPSVCIGRMVFTCPVCATSFDRRTLLVTHISTTHPDTKPYKCPQCVSVFSTQKAQRLHESKYHTSESPKVPGKRKFNHVDSSEMGLEQWIKTIHNAQLTKLEQLSMSTIGKVVNFADSVRFGVLTYTDLPYTDAEDFNEIISGWMDVELESFKPQTVNNHVRYLLVMVLYTQYAVKDVVNGFDDHIIDVLQDLVSNTQRITTVQQTRANLLNLHDPYALAQIRDRVVSMLQLQQRDVVDPMVVRHLKFHDVSSEELCVFGLDMRCWLELCMRFCNVPLRIQCSRDMVGCLSQETAYVSKLVVRDGQYCRLVNQDKTGDSHPPILIPLGSLLSAYMSFYLEFCRPRPDNENIIFQSTRGGKWTHISRDLKKYLARNGIEVDMIDPSGRFIHASRAIGIAVYAIAIDFDNQKLRGFAKLLRHSSATAERYYSIWTHQHVVTRSVGEFATAMDLDCGVPITSCTSYVPQKLKSAPSILLKCLYDNIRKFGTGISMDVVYGTRSIGTQTGDMEPEQEMCGPDTDIGPETGPKECTSCDKTMLLYGPYGVARRKRYFGRYFLGCMTCSKNGEHFLVSKCLWYPLGTIPQGKSHSSKPRNIDAITQYINANK